ncbi:MAG: transketolase [Bacteroidia bacterium]
MNKPDEKYLEGKALNIKKRFLKMYHEAGAGHIGSSLSCAEIMTFIKFSCMKENDFLILSKGHAAAALYSVLAEAGIISEEEINSFYKNNTYLSAHPPANKIKGIPFATGSLGHGLSISAGLGLASRLKKTDKKVFCVCSDGELNEGSTWEAAMFIAQQKLNNVIWFVDRNRLQGFGATEEIMSLEPLDKKMEAFGFEVLKCDGHNFSEMLQLQDKIVGAKTPTAVICNTIKGHGWEAQAGKLDSHYLPFKGDDYNNTVTNIATKK